MPKGRFSFVWGFLLALSIALPLSATNAQVQSGSIGDTVLLSETGQPVRLSDYRGKVVFVNFWGSWCSPCLQEMDSIRNLQTQLAGRRDVAFVFVSAKPNYQQNDSAWLRQHGIAGASYRAAAPGKLSVPMTYILDRSGAVAQFRSTAVDWTMHADLIRSLLPG